MEYAQDVRKLEARVRAAIKEGRIEEDLDRTDDMRTALRLPSEPIQEKIKIPSMYQYMVFETQYKPQQPTQ